jgi:hypothetical protein
MSSECLQLPAAYYRRTHNCASICTVPAFHHLPHHLPHPSIPVQSMVHMHALSPSPGFNTEYDRLEQDARVMAIASRLYASRGCHQHIPLCQSRSQIKAMQNNKSLVCTSIFLQCAFLPFWPLGLLQMDRNVVKSCRDCQGG